MAESHPEAVIENGLLRARVYLPDAGRGFYRSTRFDWSGIVAELDYAGHRFYGPWFTRTEPGVRDFVYRGSEIVAGAESSVTGPAEEFQPALGYAEATPGGTFVKVGVGVLRRPDATGYSPFASYAIVDGGTWSVETNADAVSFVHVVDDPASGHGYRYEKTLRLAAGRPELVIEHRLTNTGRQPIDAVQYNHNFFVLDGETTGPDITITVPFAIRTDSPPDSALAAIEGSRIVYARRLAGHDRVSFPIEGFGPDPSDHDVRVEHAGNGTGCRVTSDRPLARLMLWSIRSVVSMEPFVDVRAVPGASTTWRYTYTYFAR